MVQSFWSRNTHLLSGLLMIYEFFSWNDDTVDGQNPAPVHMVNIPSLTGCFLYILGVFLFDFWTINSRIPVESHQQHLLPSSFFFRHLIHRSKLEFFGLKKRRGVWEQLWFFSQGPEFGRLHPRDLTWNLKIMVLKWTFLYQGLIFRFHVKFRGCTLPETNICSTWKWAETQKERLKESSRSSNHPFSRAMLDSGSVPATGPLQKGRCVWFLFVSWWVYPKISFEKSNMSIGISDSYPIWMNWPFALCVEHSYIVVFK